MNEDFEYTKYTLWYDYDKNKISLTEKKNYSTITFGEETEYNSWFMHRIKTMNYKLIVW